MPTEFRPILNNVLSFVMTTIFFSKTNINFKMTTRFVIMVYKEERIMATILFNQSNVNVRNRIDLLLDVTLFCKPIKFDKYGMFTYSEDF